MKHKNLLKSMMSVMLLSLLTIVAISCGDDEEDPLIYTVNAFALEGGEADVSCYEVISGEKVTLTATPESGYRFKCWMLNDKEVSTENPYTVVVYKNIVYIAKFVKEEDSDNNEDGEEENPDKTYQVSVVYGEGGTAVSSDTQVKTGWEVTLKAQPEATYRFVNWTVNGEEVSTANPYIAKITSDIQFKANFEKDYYSIKVTAGEGGTAEASEAEVLNGTKVTLTATPNEDYVFVNWIVNGEEVSKENPYTVTVTNNIEYKANFKKIKENGKDFVDLGLPSGLKWATCNVGATTPEGYGDYFAWGETSPKTTYNWSTYKYCNGSYDTLTKYCRNSSFGGTVYGTVDYKTTLELTDDAARVNWGGAWRMPKEAEYDELRKASNCTWTWTTKNGVNGYKVTSKKNGNSIFLPAAGYRGSDGLGNAGSYCNYWSSSLSMGPSDYAYYVGFNSSGMVWSNYGYLRFKGLSVRAVCE